MSAPVLETGEASPFDLGAVLASVNEAALVSPAVGSEYRRTITRSDPLMFALVYLPHLLRGPDTGNEITFSQFHLDLFEQAKQWMKPLGRAREYRDAYIAPRNAGKSTLLFTVLPLWAAAHGHIDFIAAFADTADQAEGHLLTFKMELDGNKLLRHDFPGLCTPGRRPSGQTQADKQGDYISESGFIFKARGIETAVLGMKVGNRRPSLLLFDDIEPQEGKYSADQKAKRLKTLIGAIFRIRITARVVITGTVTMHGSIIHDLVRMVTDADPPEQWPNQQNIKVHYYPAIVTNPETGEEQSWWPEFLSIDELNLDRHTADFKMQMMNQPMGGEGSYWVEEDFRYGDLPGVTKVLLSVDPAVSNDKKSQDYTGIAVLGFSPEDKQCVLYHVEGVKITGKRLRNRVLELLARFPDVRMVRIENNQGKELWDDIFHDMPVPVRLHHASEKKSDRFAMAQRHWHRGRVLHAKKLPNFEEQALAYPNVTHDDLIDAVVSGVAYFLSASPAPRVSVKTQSYL